MSRLTASGRSWAIATPHDLASEVGAEAFDRGGNAVDAALAAAVALAVSYPHNCGVGGDLFALVQRPDGEALVVASTGRAPAALDPATVRAGHGQIPERGPIPITVPGAVAGWQQTYELGAVLPWSDAFDRAVRFASDGVPVARSLGKRLARDDGTLASDPGIGSVFFPDGRPRATGDVLRQPALARTLEAIADGGADAFYLGDVGRRYAQALQQAGSPITPEDLAEHRPDVVPPLGIRFADLHVRTAPPNSQGFVLLQILAAAERLELDPDPFGPDAGTLALAFHVASLHRDRYLADPDAMRVHAATLLEDGHLASLGDEIGAGIPQAVASGRNLPRGTPGDTIALVAADAQGFAVSLIQSLYSGFGAGILEPSTGIVAHNRGACFVLDPNHPNAMAPRKRPAHTLMPVLVHDRRGVAGVAGTRGGHGQPQIDAHTVLRAFALGESPAVAVAAPRWLVGGMDPAPPESPFVVAEGDVPRATVETIRSAGFAIETIGPRDESTGHAQVIRIGPDGFEAGTDPRADGSAIAG